MLVGKATCTYVTHKIQSNPNAPGWRAFKRANQLQYTVVKVQNHDLPIYMFFIYSYI